MSSDSNSDSDGSYCFKFNFYQDMVCMANTSGDSNSGPKKYHNTILIDTGSSFSCVNSKNLIVNLRKSENPINVISNGGTLPNNMEGDIHGWFTVYYNPKSIMNIFSFKDVRKRFRVTLDTAE